MTWNWKAVIQIRHKSDVYNNNRIENKNMCWTQEYTVRCKKQFWSQLSVINKLCSRWEDVQGKGREGDTDAFGSHPSMCWKTHKQNCTAGRIIPVCRVYWNKQMCLCQSVLPVPLIWLCALSTSVPLLAFFQQPRYQMLDCTVVHVFKMHRPCLQGVTYLAEIQIHMLTVCNRSQTGQVSAGTVCTVLYSSSLCHPNSFWAGSFF